MTTAPIPTEIPHGLSDITKAPPNRTLILIFVNKSPYIQKKE